jgi:hypothetical protein
MTDLDDTWFFHPLVFFPPCLHSDQPSKHILDNMERNDEEEKTEQSNASQDTKDDAGTEIEENVDYQIDDSETNNSNQELDNAESTLHCCAICKLLPKPKITAFTDNAYARHLYSMHRNDKENCPSFCWLCSCGFTFLNSTAATRHKSSFIDRTGATSCYNEKFKLPMQIQDSPYAHELYFAFTIT